VVDPGSTTANFTIVRSTEANSETALPIGTAIYVTGGVLNTAKTYYLTTSQQITAITDIDGNFTLSNLFPDIYALYVYKPGVGMLSKPTVDVITSNASNAVIRPNTYQVTGKIKHRPYLQIVEPVPLPDVRISLYRASDLFLLKKSEKSKEDGTWIFRSVPDGNYVLKADLRGMTSTVIEHKITVDDGDVNLINFEVYVSTFSPPSVPEVLNVEGGYRALTITIQEATTDLGPEVRYYQYTLDSGISWLTAQLT
jgi:hypothetical protein